MGDMQPMPEWQECLQAGLTGTIMVIGAPDSGKSTFCRFLFEGLCQQGKRTALLDSDPGQSTLGPPATIHMATSAGSDPSFPPRGEKRHWFIGSVSPRGHMLPMLTGTARLAEAARAAGAEIIIHDTCGLINPADGGQALKLAKIDMLRPSMLFAIQAAKELEALLQPLRDSQRTQVITLRPSAAIQPRDMATRRERRASRFAHYFARAHTLEVAWSNLAIFPRPVFSYQQLLALVDAQGFALGLGMISEVNLQQNHLKLITPLSSLDNVDALHLGDLTINPSTFETEPIGF